jgi:Calcium-binding EGF domain
MASEGGRTFGKCLGWARVGAWVLAGACAVDDRSPGVASASQTLDPDGSGGEGQTDTAPADEVVEDNAAGGALAGPTAASLQVSMADAVPCVGEACSARQEIGTPCDVNPCGSGRCLVQETGFDCQCDLGFGYDGSTCVDVDECTQQSNGGCDQICNNTPGGFSCACSEGYVPVVEQPSRCVAQSGLQCQSGDQCASGNCVDGSCCQVGSCGPCERCAGPTGACVPVASAQDLDTCAGDRVCDINAVCKTRVGLSCQANDECISGACTDGVCCTTACTGVCQSCLQATMLGACSRVVDVVDPDTCSGVGRVCGVSPACLRRDQSQQLADGAGALGSTAEQRMAQVVVPNVSAALRELRLGVEILTPGAVVRVEVQRVTNGVPNGVVLASSEIVGPTSAPVAVVLQTALQLQAGVPFSLVLSSDGDEIGFYGLGDPYPPGEGFFEANYNPPGWVSLGGDLVFELLVDA